MQTQGVDAMKFKDFVSLVSEMRTMQKSYFKARNEDILLESKQLERLVDKAIKDSSAQKVRLELEQDIRGFIRINIKSV